MTQAIVIKKSQDLQAGGDPLAAFGDFLKLKVADGDAAEETLRSYRAQVAQFVDWCRSQGIEPGQATEYDLEAYRRHLVEYRRPFVDQPYTRATIAAKLTAVRRFYQAATWRGLRADNPAAGLKAPRDRTTRAERIHYLPLAGLVRLLDLPRTARDRAILYLMGGHGLRVSEVAGLHLEDLDLDAGTLQVHGKGDKLRTVYLTEHTGAILRDALQARRPAEGVTAMFVTTDHRTRGQAMGARAMRHIVDGYLLAAGLKDAGISCHSLRHSFATWSLAAGGELLAISAKLGHSSIDTTRVYAKIVDEMQHNPTLKLEGLLFSDRAPSARSTIP